MRFTSRYFITGMLLVLFLATWCTPDAYAVPASPVLHTVSQPDGTTFNLRQWGDERISGFESEDGYTILLDEVTQTWLYAEKLEDGSLKPSSLHVGIDLPTPDIPKHLRPTPPTIIEPEVPATDGTSVKQLGKTVAATVAPVSGTRNIPVILVNFADTNFTHSPESFTTLLFGTSNNSMKDYYHEVSYNNLTVSPGSAGVIGPVTVSKSHNYYGQDLSGVKDYWGADMVYEAVRAADAKINFAEYDQNGDCIVDNVIIVHQGTGQEASPNNYDIWSKQWTLSGSKQAGRLNYPGAYTTNDLCPSGGYMKVDTFTIQPEINSDGGMITIGIFAHEYGHALGLPDLYDYGYDSEGVGNWSLMAGGSYMKTSRTGDSPAHLDAWSKYKLGWVTPTQVNGTMINEPIMAASSSANVYQLLQGTPESGEYFLVENRQKTGFDAGLPGSGLLVWHVDGNRVSNRSRINDNQCIPALSNCTSTHYAISLEQADGSWQLEKNLSSGDQNDPFPGSLNKTLFSAATSPNSNLWNGTPSNVNISNISPSGQTMTATLSVTDCSYALTSRSTTFQAVAATASFQILAGAGCSWNSLSNTPWITITSGSSGTGSGSVTFSYAANTENTSRQGSITAGGLTYSIIQTATATGTGVSSTLLNGDFELGRVAWIESSSGNYDIVANNADFGGTHSGLWSAYLGGYDSAFESIRQTITIPSGVSQASISFWYRVFTEETDAGTQYDTLKVQLLDQYNPNFVVTTLKTLSNLDHNSGYQQTQTIDLTPYKGQTIQLAFVAATDTLYQTSFLIDDITLVTSSMATVSVAPERRLYNSGSALGTITVTGTGVWTAVSDSSWATITSGASGTNNGTVNFSVAANTAPTYRKATINIANKTVTIIQDGTVGSQSLITNGDFESGSLGWNQSASNIISSSSTWKAASGSYYAWLAGFNNANENIYQRISIPTSASDIYLQYYYSISSTETATVTEYDRLFVYLSDPTSGDIVSVLNSYSNLQKSSYWNQSEAIDLSGYKGRTLNLVIGAINDATFYTTFLVDNIVLKAFYDVVLPSVSSVSPQENSIGVPVSSIVSATISKQINIATLGPGSFIVSDGSATVSGDMSYDSTTMKIYFTPSVPLSYGKTYSVSLTSAIKDLSNNSLTAKTWSFTTVVVPVNGVCGSNNNANLASLPTINLCTFGTPTTVTGTGPWNWTCTGANSGTTATCSANIQVWTISSGNGANGSVVCTSPVYNGATSTCTITPASGYQLAAFTDNSIDKKASVTGNSYSINNVTANHSIVATFTLTQSTSVNGACGTSNIGTFSAAPTTNLCTTGTASTIIGSGTWYWACPGTNGGTTAICTAFSATSSATITLTKAKVFLGANGNNYAVNNSGTTLYGNTGIDTVTIAPGVTGVTLDQNIERINFSGASSSYAFKQTGNLINIYDASNTTLLLAKAPVQGDANGTLLSFSDVTASALLAAGVMTLGGITVAATPLTLVGIAAADIGL